MLAHYGHVFGAVEVDASYYGILKPQAVARMVRQTPETFKFCFKVPSTITHRIQGARVHPDARAFAESVAPVIQAAKFGAALLQFPNGFRRTPANESYFLAAARALDGVPLVAEFRNREWQTPQTHAMLVELGIGWCNVDMPVIESLMLAGADATSAVGYVRFHGRNSAQWWIGDNTTRYDYDYTPEELQPWAARVAEINAAAEATFAFFNNHARGNAARNAEMFEKMLRFEYGPAADRELPARQDAPSQGTLFP